MNKIHLLTTRLASWFNGIAALAVAAMMTLTCLDVFLRLWRHPIPGTYEIVSMLGAVFVSFSLARTSVDQGHIAVDFLVIRLPKKWQNAIEAINDGVAALLFTAIAYQSVIYAGDLKAYGEVSMTLQLPIHPFVLGVAVGSTMLCLVLYTSFAARLIDAVNPAVEA